MGTVETWRAQLRDELARAVGQSVLVADLFLAVREAIPLHHAARTCAKSKSMSPMHMRFRAFKVELLRLNVKVDAAVERGHNKHLRMTMHVTPQTKPCAHCGTRFFGPRIKQHCTLSCRSLAQHARVLRVAA